MAQQSKVTVPVSPTPWKEGDREVPAVLGHDEGQPAYGVAVKTWRDGDKLKADLVNVPKEVCDAIKAGAYFQTSAEVYDDTGEAGLAPGGGCMLRRIALLGADIPQVKTLADLPKPTEAGVLPGVEIFAVGTHRGIKYRESDLDSMVKNFQRYSAPAVKFSDGRPRHKVTMVRKFAQGGEQTGPHGGKFHISESGTKVYDGGGSSAGGGKSSQDHLNALFEKAMKKPKLKAQYEASQAERNKKKIGNAFFTKNSDEVTMDRSRIIDALVAAGMDKAAAEAMDDATLQALAPVCDQLSPGSQPPEMMDETKPDETPATKDQPPPADESTTVVKNDEAAPDAAGFDRNAVINQLVSAGGDPDELAALSDDDLKMRAKQMAPATDNAESSMDDQVPPDAPGTTPQADSEIPPVQKLAACAKKMSSKKYAEQQVSALHSQLEQAKKQIDQTLAQSAKDVKAAKFETFKEKLRAAGKLVPAMEEGGLLDDFVLTLDHSTVRKFGESKKTQFDMLQEILDRVPRVVKYGEQMKTSVPGVVKHAELTPGDEEKVVRERFRKFTEGRKITGYSEDEAVKAFKLRKAKNPMLTVDDVYKV